MAIKTENTDTARQADAQAIGSDLDSRVPSAAFCGQVKIATTGTAIQFGNPTIKRGITIIANPSNTDSVAVGGSNVTAVVDGTGNGLILAPGQSISIPLRSVSGLYLNGNIGDFISFIAS